MRKATRYGFFIMAFQSLIVTSHLCHAQGVGIYEPLPAGVQGSTPSSQPAASAGAKTTSSMPLPLSDELSKQTGCKPEGDAKCSLSVSKAAEFLKFARQCESLKGWLISYSPSKYMLFTIVGGAVIKGCQVTVDMSEVTEQPEKKTCTLTPEQLQGMTNDDAIKAAEAYDANPVNNNQLAAIGKPMMDCIGPLNKVTIRLESAPSETPSTQTTQ
ncbi:hypothetical protein AQUSIP_21930 [Aquicella siphonis]|uniref:Uncharacterized protein n=1 Tax=Aquicella siphonis TaxID=254247 RepID=A0A5E4PKY0_9COXI|nr:hypothetical protein [Aquicella siphonis]VVC76866.1 hypothetical protein AQUSIP_21930 [Aquicella siphonis]